jgi:hypothetical protein
LLRCWIAQAVALYPATLDGGGSMTRQEQIRAEIIAAQAKREAEAAANPPPATQKKARSKWTSPRKAPYSSPFSSGPRRTEAPAEPKK